ncbi:MAG: hypothetical protein A2086_02820 [Spirochaetes bacterium GWD1_27_9]|nr:MAG: hypothetical protein A2Y34_17180 [Spirochaetes bacterium GWC1_27_15]OHD31384.1 MAG: hypothetical protein A2086_02820 [Spirochaetes bacterium GWD1_27_9]
MEEVKIFIAANKDVNNDRKTVENTINELNQLYNLKIIPKEYSDMESGSYDIEIQQQINKLLEECQVVICLFYSKIGEYTYEEYKIARNIGKKVFVYFKTGYSPTNKQEMDEYGKVLELKENITKENTLFFKEYSTNQELINIVNKDLNYLLKDKKPNIEAKLFTKNSPAKEIDFFGREKDLEDIENILKTNNTVLLVNGLGGIGKTEVCKYYFWQHIDKYKYVGWINCISALKESLVFGVNESVVGNDIININERFAKITEFLTSRPKETLLIIDNIESEDDPTLSLIKSLPIKVIVSSRNKLKGFKIYQLQFLDEESLLKIFYNFYQVEKNDEFAKSIIKLCGLHTLTVELLAKTAQNTCDKLEIFYNKLITIGFNLNKAIPEKIDTFWHNEVAKKQFFDHILKVFELSNLSSEEIFVLTNLSILPYDFIEVIELANWLELTDKTPINELIKKGWINQKEDKIIMHKMIAAAVKEQTKPNSEKCEKLIISMIKNLNCEPTDNPLQKDKYTDFAEEIILNIKEENEEIANLSNNLSTIYIYLGDLNKALDFGLKSLEIFEKILDKNHPHIASSYNNLSMIYRDLGELNKALDFGLKSLEIFEKILDKNHPSLATSYNNLSTIYRDLGELNKALDFGLKSLEIFEKILDKNHPYLAACYNNLSMIYKDLGDLNKALDFGLKDLEILEKILDKNHPSLAISYNNLSMIYLDLGDLNKALDFGLKSLEIREKILDKNHPSLATSYNNLSTIYRDLGELNKALDFGLKDLEISKKILDKNHPSLTTSYNNLSMIYLDLGDLKKALDFGLKSLEIREKILDKNHPDIATSYNNLSLIYKDLGDLKKALDFGLKSLEIREEILDKNHPYIATSYHNLSMIYLDLKNYTDAEIYCKKAIEIMEKKFPKGHPNLVVIKENLKIIQYFKKSSNEIDDLTRVFGLKK